MAETDVGYFVPRTFAEVSGTVSFAYDWVHDAVERSVAATVEFGVERDPGHWYRYDGDGSFLANREMSFQWAGDGRLTSAAMKSTGMAGVILKGLTTLAASVFMLAEVSPDPCVPPRPVAKTAWEQFKDTSEANRLLAERKERADTASSQISQKIVDASAQPSNDPEAEKALVVRLSRLRRIQTYLDKESATVGQIFAAWKSSESKKKLADQLATLRDRKALVAGGAASYRLLVEDLPTVAAFEEAAQRPGAVSKQEFKNAGGTDAAWAVVENLLTVVARAELSDPSRPMTGKTANDYRANADSENDIKKFDGVLYRIGRPVAFSIYEVRGAVDPANGEFVICSAERKAVVVHNVVNSESAAGYVKFKDGFFAARSGEISIGDAGSIAKMGSSKGSEFAAAVGALGEVPGYVADAFTRANEIIDQKQARDLQAIDHRIAELTKEKELLEAEIVEHDKSRWRIKDRARLQAAIDHLTAVKALGDARSALLPAPSPDPTPSTLEELLASGDVSSVEIKLPES